MSSTDQVVPAPSTARKRKLNATKTNGNTSADTNERVDTILTGDDPPWPGNSYIISQLSSSKVLTCRGVLGLRLEKYTGDSSQRWCCHATDGWLEFATDPVEILPNSTPPPVQLPGDDAPWPGKTYVITDLATPRKALTCGGSNSIVDLQPYSGLPSQHWRCHIMDGWFEFANDTDEAGSTLYLEYHAQPGHSPIGFLQCSKRSTGRSALFCVRKRPEYGFQIMAKHGERLSAVNVVNVPIDPQAHPSSSKPSTGYLGRWLAYYLHTNKLASEIRIVDKQLPQLAWLAPEFEEACKNFIHADMSKDQSIQKAFDREDGSAFDYVFNCAGETKYAQNEEVYKQRNLDLPVLCAKEAAIRGVKLFVELSEGRVYGDYGKGKKETCERKPWLTLAKYKLKAEEELQKIEGLNLIILRLANAYGPYSSKSISTAMCYARVHQFLGEKMEILWTKDLRVNTVHVSDVNRAIWHATEWYMDGRANWLSEWGTTPIFNIVDDGDTSQGTIAEIVEGVFKIRINFVGTVLSQLAKLNLEEAVDDANELCLQPWADMLQSANITRPGLISPYIEIEQLKDSDLSLDGTRFKTVTGFEYDVPEITTAKVEEMLDSYKRMNWWP
ncbi:hypothetical protein Dda_0782 [Drechslerella dactyloides]|uniref:NAD-dependent epimerase/dehydratase domain-containing protein n=1 Tax=Drechslerella dactyloides TaxID=74499 RepID=A0AAD6J514_DREDA|nr:hypothetical protein Dda_0782 [Drechslerella dactyloides]